MFRSIFVPLALTLLAGSCGTSDDRHESELVVARFYEAVDADDGAAACRELGESLLEQVESQTQRSCPEAITGFEYEPAPVEGVEVYITNAKVDLRSGESAFLGREPDGWRLSAIGCRAEKGKPADRPFECEAEA